MYRIDTEGRLQKYIDAPVARAQDVEKLYRISGAVYVTARDTLMNENKIVDNASCAGVIVPRERSTDIDTPSDFLVAEVLMKKLLD
jgi:CMP-N-acetylneuraminic acid synthetase